MLFFTSWWSSSSTKSEVPGKNTLNPQGIKPCCACPETKSARDECFLRSDPDKAHEACADLVRRHVECMRGYGFKI